MSSQLALTFTSVGLLPRRQNPSAYKMCEFLIVVEDLLMKFVNFSAFPVELFRLVVSWGKREESVYAD